MLIDSVVHMTIKWPFWKLSILLLFATMVFGWYGETFDFPDNFVTSLVGCTVGLAWLFLPFYGLYRFNKYFQVTQTLFGDD